MGSGLSSARLSAYDATISLRAVTENGVGDQNDKGSPAFISRQDLSGNDDTDAVSGVIGFNNALVKVLHLSAPEPASLFLIGAGLLGICGYLLPQVRQEVSNLFPPTDRRILADLSLTTDRQSNGSN